MRTYFFYTTEIRFDNKMTNNGDKVYILTISFYNSTNNTTILDPKKLNPVGKVSVHPKGVEYNNQTKMTTKYLET